MADVRVACPDCNTVYIISRDHMPIDGRKVRCSSCSHTWVASTLNEKKSGDTIKRDIKSSVGEVGVKPEEKRYTYEVEGTASSNVSTYEKIDSTSVEVSAADIEEIQKNILKIAKVLGLVIMPSLTNDRNKMIREPYTAPSREELIAILRARSESVHPKKTVLVPEPRDKKSTVFWTKPLLVFTALFSLACIAILSAWISVTGPL